jgi:RING-H2 zinc finger domain
MYPIRPTRLTWAYPFLTPHQCTPLCGASFEQREDEIVITQTDEKCELVGSVDVCSIQLYTFSQGEEYIFDQPVIRLPLPSVLLMIDFPLETPYIRTYQLTDLIQPPNTFVTATDLLLVFKEMYEYVYQTEEERSPPRDYVYTEQCGSCDPTQYASLQHLSSTPLDEPCSICQSDIAAVGVELECAHKFHAECLQQWVAKANTCPLCRAPVFNCAECNGTRGVQRTMRVVVPPFMEFNGGRPPTDGPFGISDYYFEELCFKGMHYNRLTNTLSLIPC